MLSSNLNRHMKIHRKESNNRHISKDRVDTSDTQQNLLSVKEEAIDDDDDYKFQKDPLELEREMEDREDADDTNLNNLKDYGERDPLNIKQELEDEEGEIKVDFNPEHESLKEESDIQDLTEDSKDGIHTC